MRPLAVILFGFIIIGGLYTYLSIAERPIDSVEFDETEAAGKFTVELTLPFEAASNEFSEEVALLIQLDGRLVRLEKERVPAGIYRIEDVQGIKVGRNEFLVNVQPSRAEFQPSAEFSLESSELAGKEIIPVAVRLRVFRDEIQLDEFTVWSQPGLPIIASFLIQVDGEQFGGGDDD